LHGHWYCLSGIQEKYKILPNLEISLSENTQIHWREEATSNGGTHRIETEHPAIRFKFSNQTGSTIYLSNARLLKCTKIFNISMMQRETLQELTN